MAYTAVKGGTDAILAAEALIAAGPGAGGRLDPAQVASGARLLVDQVMGEGGLYAPELAALALAQAEGDPIEAAFLLRAYRSTLPRLAYGLPPAADAMRVRRRISSAFKEIPGGQVLGRTRDYTQRLLDVDGPRALALAPPAPADEPGTGPPGFPRVVEELRGEGLIGPLPAVAPENGDGSAPEPFDITREAPRFPAPRSARLQTLARGETGFMVAMAYSVMRGFGAGHGTIAELRHGDLPVVIRHPLTGGVVTLGAVAVTEVEGVSHASTGVGGSGAAGAGLHAGAGDGADDGAARLTLGYGVVFGQNERKAIAMAILDQSLSIPGNEGPAADEEFVLQHCDPLEASGFIEHLKLPHYVTFQSQLDRLRAERRRRLAGAEAGVAVGTGGGA